MGPVVAVPKLSVNVPVTPLTKLSVCTWLTALVFTETVALPGDVELREGMVVKVVNMDNSNIKDTANEAL